MPWLAIYWTSNWTLVAIEKKKIKNEKICPRNFLFSTMSSSNNENANSADKRSEKEKMIAGFLNKKNIWEFLENVLTAFWYLTRWFVWSVGSWIGCRSSLMQRTIVSIESKVYWWFRGIIGNCSKVDSFKRWKGVHWAAM